jgi:hypothetical protein
LPESSGLARVREKRAMVSSRRAATGLAAAAAAAATADMFADAAASDEGPDPTRTPAGSCGRGDSTDSCPAAVVNTRVNVAVASGDSAMEARRPIASTVAEPGLPTSVGGEVGDRADPPPPPPTAPLTGLISEGGMKE